MTAVKHKVTIKGVKDGLVFLLDDSCGFDQLLDELKHKLEKTHQNILSGPRINVQVKMGKRFLGEAEKDQISTIITSRGNLIVQSIDSEVQLVGERKPGRFGEMQLIKGMVRSGQTLHIDGHITLLGDVNPGGTISATGNIYVMGSLRGLAHAGTEGDESAIIAASHLRPTQLRIAQVISRPPDEWGVGETFMEFAYIRDGVMEIDKIQLLHRIRPDAAE